MALPRVLKDIRITEVSSVDRGAGRGVKVMLMKRDGDDEPYWKREFSSEERQSAADAGQALPDGSFPIKSVDDLKNAIQAIGRAKDPGKAKAHIKSRARALGQSDLIPDTWKSEGGMPTIEELAKQLDEMKTKVEKGEKVAADAITAIAALKHENAVLKMSDSHKAYMAQMDGDDKKKNFAAMSSDERDAHIQKNPLKKVDEDPRIAKALAESEATKAENADLKKRLGVIEERETRAAFEKRAEGLGLKAEHGEIMRKAYSGDVTAQAELDKLIKQNNDALAAVMKTGRIFSEFGKRGTGGGTTALEELTAKAEELRKSAAGKDLTEQQAFTKVYTDPANVEIVQRHKREESTRHLQVVA